MAGELSSMLAMPIGGAGYSFAWKPSALESPFYGGSGQSRKLNPFGNRSGYAISRNQSAASPVSGLFDFGGPSHIAGGVIPVVVDSVNRVFGTGLIAKILGKLNKRLSPFLMEFNSTSAVIVKRWVIGIGAPLKNLSPSLVYVGLAHSVSRSYRCHGLLLQTPTAFRWVLVKQVSRLNDLFSATVADAFPPSAIATRVKRKNCEPPGTKPGDVFEVCHKGIIRNNGSK